MDDQTKTSENALKGSASSSNGKFAYMFVALVLILLAIGVFVYSNQNPVQITTTTTINATTNTTVRSSLVNQTQLQQVLGSSGSYGTSNSSTNASDPSTLRYSSTFKTNSTPPLTFSESIVNVSGDIGSAYAHSRANVLNTSSFPSSFIFSNYSSSGNGVNYTVLTINSTSSNYVSVSLVGYKGNKLVNANAWSSNTVLTPSTRMALVDAVVENVN